MTTTHSPLTAFKELGPNDAGKLSAIFETQDGGTRAVSLVIACAQAAKSDTASYFKDAAEAVAQNPDAQAQLAEERRSLRTLRFKAEAIRNEARLG